MIRQAFVTRHESGDRFRWRSHEVTRLEGFSDAVFAFAVTLLVVSLEVPRTYGELTEAMRGLLAFAICFATLVYFWWEHFKFFRRYGLDDPLTVTINGALVFVLLYYVFPLKFLFSIVTAPLTGQPLYITTAQGPVPVIGAGDIGSLFIIYGAGFAGVYGLFGFLYLRAWSRREHLDLDAAERAITLIEMTDHFLTASIGLISVAVVLIAGVSHGLPGWIYFLIPLEKTIVGSVGGARLRRITDDRD